MPQIRGYRSGAEMIPVRLAATGFEFLLTAAHDAEGRWRFVAGAVRRQPAFFFVFAVPGAVGICRRPGFSVAAAEPASGGVRFISMENFL